MSVLGVLVLCLSTGTSDAKRPKPKELPVIGQTDLPVAKAGLHVLEVNGEYVYLYGPKDGLLIVDVFDKENPRLVNSTDELPKQVFGFTSDGNRAFINCGPKGLFLFDGSNRPSPIVVDTGVKLAKENIWITEDLLVAIAKDNAFVVYDVSNAVSPVEIGGLPGRELRIHEIVGSRIFATNRLANLVIVDLTSPTDPTVLGSVSIGGYKPLVGWIKRDMVVSGDYIYVAHERGKAKVVDASDPANPVVLSKFGPGAAPGIGRAGAAEIEVTGDRVYLNAPNGLYAFDVSDKANPKRILKKTPTRSGSGLEHLIGVREQSLYAVGPLLNIYDVSTVTEDTADWETTRLSFYLDKYWFWSGGLGEEYLYLVTRGIKNKEHRMLVVVDIEDLQ